LDVPDNVFWAAFAGAQRALTVGTERARRYRPGIAGLIAFDDNARPAFDELLPFCAPGEPFYGPVWPGPVPAGWEVRAEAPLTAMAWSGGPAPAPVEGAVPLGESDLPAILELVDRTRPGPFGPGNLLLGRYFGRFEEGRLVAMAGERLQAGHWREVSAVCTDPGWQGRGLGGATVRAVVREQLAAGERPFLHVLAANTGAIALYRKLGFETVRTVPVRVVARTGGGNE
jgi:GNAT superfamily N-acetyltransferase